MAKKTIAIIDYAMGNIRSVQQGLRHIAPNDWVIVTNDKTRINSADKIVFPGQGAMGACMSALEKHDLIDVIKLCASEKPFLGICLGLQLLFDHSGENGGIDGLGIIGGEVARFTNNELKIPHMGWNTVKQIRENLLWHKIDDDASFYAVHSYFVVPDDNKTTIGSSNYGVDFSCAIAKGNLFAVQFHPEKSQHNGLQLLKNFSQIKE